MYTNFDAFVNESENDHDTSMRDIEKEEQETSKDNTIRTKEERVGYTRDSKEIVAKLKLGHAIEFTPDDLRTLSNMKVTQYESDMYDYTRGKKDYKIMKNSSGKFTIFHYHKTLHRLVPIGTFRIE